MRRYLIAALLLALFVIPSSAARRAGHWSGEVMLYDTLKRVTLDTTATRNVSRSLFQLFQVEVCSCSTSVTVVMEGSLDSLKWFNLNDRDVNTTLSAEGTYAMLAEVRVQWIRFRIVSSVGAGAKVLPRYFGGYK